MYPIPHNEARRLASLPEYDLVGSAPELEYDQLTELAAQLMGVPICLITIVGEDLQWFKSHCGLEAPSTPRSVAFCAHTIMSRDQFIILDATQDRRFRDNPLVTGPPFVRFYAGAPLTGEDGLELGSLCLIDTVAHAAFDDTERRLLDNLAAIVSERFKLRRARHLHMLAEAEAKTATERYWSEFAQRAQTLESVRSSVRAVVDNIDTLNRRLRTLAINASIEAARAGETGLGFAAVAQEVNRLALDTRAATARAAALLDS